ncbi:MAG: hypothetical protein U5K79_04125 [Cyclobacteriaceae bacterium]|nr:hypothetical protein [Cyclobacteriaceae bacterium]
MFPERYRNGAFVALHGSWKRERRQPQMGYAVVFLPFKDRRKSLLEKLKISQPGFAGVESVESPTDAKFRPTGLAMGPDGSLFICDSVHGRIWRIYYYD